MGHFSLGWDSLCSGLCSEFLINKKGVQTMAIAIKSSTAKQAYQDMIQAFSDAGRLGKTVNCPNCGEEYVLYYGERIDEDEAIAWLVENMPRACPSHRGWLALDEASPTSAEEHRRRVETAITPLQHTVDTETAAATQALGIERERLILSYSEKEATIRELRQELENC